MVKTFETKGIILIPLFCDVRSSTYNCRFVYMNKIVLFNEKKKIEMSDKCNEWEKKTMMMLTTTTMMKQKNRKKCGEVHFLLFIACPKYFCKSEFMFSTWMCNALTPSPPPLIRINRYDLNHTNTLFRTQVPRPNDRSRGRKSTKRHEENNRKKNQSFWNIIQHFVSLTRQSVGISDFSYWQMWKTKSVAHPSTHIWNMKCEMRVWWGCTMLSKVCLSLHYR